MLSVDVTAAPAHPLTNWVPGEGFVDGGWPGSDEPLTVSSANTLEERESINVLAYVANGTPNELSERLERIYAYLTLRPELRLVGVVEDMDGRRLREVVKMARTRVDAIVTTADSIGGPEHMRIAEEIFNYLGVKLIVTGFYRT